MTSISKPITRQQKEQHLRPFDMRRDLQAVTDLVELCFQDTLDESGRRYLRRMRSMAGNPAMLQWTAMTAQWTSVPLSGYVWEQDGRVVGNTSLIPHYASGRRFYLIANVAVHPDYRRQGIARQLTIKAIERARQRNVPSVWLHVRENNAAAVDLYRDLGFIERTRRTTWIGDGQPLYAAVETPQALRIAPARPRHWGLQRYWLASSYPPEFSWHLPLKTNALRPGPLGWFYRILYSVYVEGWAATRGDQLLGVASWQTGMDGGDDLWLASPPDGDPEAVRALLAHARQQLHPQRSLTLDYPARQYERAIREAGFYEHHTLIWMELVL